MGFTNLVNRDRDCFFCPVKVKSRPGKCGSVPGGKDGDAAALSHYSNEEKKGTMNFKTATDTMARINAAAATYADLIRPTERGAALVYDASLIVGGSLLVALAAQVSIRLPFSPVPITGQTLAVLLIGALLGSRRGALSLVAYLLQGLIGLPVFASGAAGPAYVMGPTGGYLIGFIAAAYVTGRLAERGWDRDVISTFLTMLIGNAIIYTLGLSWLSIYVGKQAIALGMIPFLLGDVIKLALAATALPSGWKLLKVIS
jgi:biotin transport system substrate-specific component